MYQFEMLLQDNFTVLQRYVNFKVSDRQDAEDIVQEVCLAATEKYGSLKTPDSFKPWLIGIANHKIKDYYRRKSKVMNIPLDSLPESCLETGKIGAFECSAVSDTLSSLGDNEKQVMYLYYFKELDQAQISKRLGIPVGTVKSRLHYAKKKFKQYYPYNYEVGGNDTMKKLPDILPEYRIKALDKPEFSVTYEETPNWFIIPKIGESISWASYDMPGRKITERAYSKVVSKVCIHGVDGVEIHTEFKSVNGGTDEPEPLIYYAQLTDTHFRWLGECYVDGDGVKRMLTFLDGEDFTDDWGYGEDNCGSEIHLKPKGIIKRDGDDIKISTDKDMIDVTGRYEVSINGRLYDTVSVVEYFSNGALTEHYVDRTGRTVLWRRFNKNDWAHKRYGKLWSEMLPENQRLRVNGEVYVHWYDCISDYII